jgi:transcriptional regulator with XRE-family HTH domain
MRACSGKTIYSAPIAGTKSTYNKGRGERLKRLRTSRPEVSQKAVAAAAGVTPSRVREWEKGAGMYADSLEKVAAFFGVEVEWLENEVGEERRTEVNFIDGLRRLEGEVRKQGRAIEEIRKALVDDPRWPLVEDSLNLLGERLQKVAIQAQDEDERDESQRWSPIDLSPEEQGP